MSFRSIFVISALSIMLVSALPFFERSEGNAIASEKQETALTMKADTNHLSGINLFIARLYNEDRVLYATMVTLVMAVLGTSLAFVTDLVLKALGLEVSRISHRE